MSAKQIAGTSAKDDLWESVRVAQTLELFDQYPYLVAGVVENVTGTHPGLDRAKIAQAVREEYAGGEVPKILVQIHSNEKGDPRDLQLDNEAAREELERR